MTYLLLQAGTSADLKGTLAAVFPKEPRNFSTCDWHEGFGVWRPVAQHKGTSKSCHKPVQIGNPTNNTNRKNGAQVQSYTGSSSHLVVQSIARAGPLKNSFSYCTPCFLSSHRHRPQRKRRMKKGVDGRGPTFNENQDLLD